MGEYKGTQVQEWKYTDYDYFQSCELSKCILLPSPFRACECLVMQYTCNMLFIVLCLFV